MKSLKLNSFEISKAVVPLGVQGENGTRYVYYDASEMVSDLGAGTFSYYYQPEGIAAYPMPNTWRDGNKLCVTLTSSDMAIAGKGFLQFVYRPNSPADGAMKTVELATFVAPALGSGGTAPDPWESYIERAEEAMEVAEDAADRAEAAATEVENPVSYAPQTLTEAQQGQARENIAAGMLSRNLIDNSWFTINQRGVTSWAKNVYGVDRWETYECTATVNADHTITLTPSSGGTLLQALENREEYVGKVMTMSVMMADGTIYSGSNVFDRNVVFFDNSTLRLEVNPSKSPQIVPKISGITIKAVKLELGSASTLANDVAPDYADELLKCQRYFWRLGGKSIGLMMASCFDSGNAYGVIQFPVTMRATPTFSSSVVSSMNVMQGGGTRAITAITAQLLNPQTAEIRATASGMAQNASAWLRTVSSGGYIEFSAEL